MCNIMFFTLVIWFSVPNKKRLGINVIQLCSTRMLNRFSFLALFQTINILLNFPGSERTDRYSHVDTVCCCFFLVSWKRNEVAFRKRKLIFLHVSSCQLKYPAFKGAPANSCSCFYQIRK